MRSFELSNVVQLAAHDFWALKTDSSFDRFCSESEGCLFQITKLVHSLDADGNETVSTESDVTAEENPLPTALQALLGTNTFALCSRSWWWRKRFDREHPLTFETTPQGQGLSRRKVVIRGQTWVEPLTDESCRVFYRVEIEGHLFYQSLSKLLEQGLEKRMRPTYPKLAALAYEYWYNKDSYRYLLDTPETLDRHLRATATPMITTVGRVAVLDSPLPPPPPPPPMPLAAAYLLSNLEAAGASSTTADSVSPTPVGASAEMRRAISVGPDSPFVRFRSPFLESTPLGEPCATEPPASLNSGGETFRAAAHHPNNQAVAEATEADAVAHHDKHTARQLLLWTCGHGERNDGGDHPHLRAAARLPVPTDLPKSSALSALTTTKVNATPLRTPADAKQLGRPADYTSPHTGSPSRTPVHRADTLFIRSGSSGDGTRCDEA